MVFGDRSKRRQKQYRKKGWWDDRTLHGVFEKAVSEGPEQTALIDPPDTQELIGRAPLRATYLEVEHAANNLALRIYEAGIGKGDRVLAQLPNTAELVVLYLALSRLGAVISPAPMQYGRHEIAHACEMLQPAAFITMGAFKGQAFAAARDPAVPPSVKRFTMGGEAQGYAPLGLETQAGDRIAPRLGAGEDIVTICWTSGTTGTPKGVPRHHAHWFAQTLAVMDAVPLKSGAAMLNPFPLTNMASLSGFFFFWPQARGTLILHNPFDLPVFFKQLVVERAAYTIAPPAVLNMFLQNEALHSQVDLSNVEYIASGSAPLAPWMVKGFKERFGVEIINFFGSNEGIGLVGGPEDVPDPEMRATVFPRYGDRQFTWSNRFAERFESKLVDFEDSDRVIAKAGVTGELLIRGPNVFDGYLGDARGRSEVFDKDGFFRTGDLFQIAGTGPLEPFYRFVGRRKDLIIRGGMNISPEELDAILSEHPAIAECAVAGYADPVMGERVCLFAVLHPEARLDLEAVSAFLEEKGVAKFKWPERLEIIEALPRNALGKVVRAELTALLQSQDA